MSRQAIADATGLNVKTIYRIEAGTRRTRRRTLTVIAELLSDSPEALVTELVEVAGPALAPESPYVERIEARRLRRLRRTFVLAQREQYAAERAALEADWARRAAGRLALRSSLRTIDRALRALRRLGAL